MKRRLDLRQWNRREHYQFFKGFEEPFFGVCVNIDCTAGYAKAKEQSLSFFLYYLYQSLASANEVEPFRYRIIGDDVFVYDEVHASPTINRPDGTFGFAYMNYQPTLEKFLQEAATETERVRASTGLVAAVSGENVIHYSSIPWLNFTSLSHARSFSFKDSCPKISFGKMTEEGGKRTMPVSVHVHHALMDGYHVGQFVESFQARINA